MNKFNLGLTADVEKEINVALSYLNSAESEQCKDILSRLIACAYDIQTNRHLNKEHLDILEEGMRHPRELIFYSYSGCYVNSLSHHFEEARALYQRLVDDKSSGVRFNAVTAMLGNSPPESVVARVLGKCCNDKSGKVRKKVADVCLRLDMRQMLPLLERQYETECDEKVKENLHFSIELLKNGYILENCGNGKLSLTAHKGTSTRFFDEKYLGLYKIEDIVASFEDKRKFPWE